MEYCPIISNMLRVMRVAIGKVQRASTTNPFGPTSSLNQRGRYELPQLDPLWLRCVKVNLIFLFSVIKSRAYKAGNAIRFADQCSYPPRNRPLSLGIPLYKASFGSKCICVLYLVEQIARPCPVLSESIQECIIHISQHPHFSAQLCHPLTVSLLRPLIPTTQPLYHQSCSSTTKTK